MQFALDPYTLNQLESTEIPSELQLTRHTRLIFSQAHFCVMMLSGREWYYLYDKQPYVCVFIMKLSTKSVTLFKGHESLQNKSTVKGQQDKTDVSQ